MTTFIPNDTANEFCQHMAFLQKWEEYAALSPKEQAALVPPPRLEIPKIVVGLRLTDRAFKEDVSQAIGLYPENEYQYQALHQIVTLSLSQLVDMFSKSIPASYFVTLGSPHVPVMKDFEYNQHLSPYYNRLQGDAFKNAFRRFGGILFGILTPICDRLPGEIFFENYMENALVIGAHAY